MMMRRSFEPSGGAELGEGNTVTARSAQGGPCLPFRVLGGNVGDEHDLKVPLIGDRRIEPLSPADTEALVEASEEAVRAELANPITSHGSNPFSTRHM
jgi:hypothetical protein